MIPPKANAAFVAAKEDVPEVCTRPCDPARPRDPQADPDPARARSAHHHEYERAGVDTCSDHEFNSFEVQRINSSTAKIQGCPP